MSLDDYTPIEIEEPDNTMNPTEDNLDNPNPTETTISENTTRISLVMQEARCMDSLALPMILTSILLYCPSMVSILFLGHLGELALVDGSHAIGFANITGYSVCSGLAMGMESSLLHPLGIYLRVQSITMPITLCYALATLLHIPITYLLVLVLKLGIRAVALGSSWTRINLVGSLIIYLKISGVYKRTWCGISWDCFRGWRSLLNLSIPSCLSVCLEWWWYEIITLLCGWLSNPQATVALMGILIQTTSLIYIIPSSLSFGMSTRVRNELRANNPLKAKLAATVGLFSTFILGFSALAFAILVGKKWVTIFTKDPEIIALTWMVLHILGLRELGSCPQTTGCGVLRGTARPKLGANINLGCFYLIGMPIAVWLSFFAGFDFKGLWFGLLAAQVSCMVTMVFIVARTIGTFKP
ncbi:Multi antimicrobial extrusion protein [Corchorus capsularis]|uniref:Multi antimicrobial extrusion protein n=1 Tax=Corchorus capsularis TaxID=210143 RepID=A0A1R3G5A6_COCAP|nr:Multi antimicrobial extrusion protein [Corchorus capsularis]